MLNYVWAFMIIFSLICASFEGNMAELSKTILSSGADTVSLFLKTTGVMSIWCGLMNIAEQSGLCSVISRVFSPVLRLLFPSIKDKKDTLNSISMNITANLLGLGNAATPLGITAIKKMQSENENKCAVTKDMAVFVVMNTAALRLIPSTVGALRESWGAAEPMDIIFCVWLSSALSLFVAVFAVRLTWRFTKN